MKMLLVLIAAVLLAGCGSLERKAAQVNPGDSKGRVLAVMGAPGDRQFQGNAEVWQYGQTGAGFGYHDYRVIWFRDGVVTGLSSYKSHAAGSLAASHFEPVHWEQAPDVTLEVRQR